VDHQKKAFRNSIPEGFFVEMILHAKGGEFTILYLGIMLSGITIDFNTWGVLAGMIPRIVWILLSVITAVPSSLFDIVCGCFAVGTDVHFPPCMSLFVILCFEKRAIESVGYRLGKNMTDYVLIYGKICSFVLYKLQIFLYCF